MLFCHESLVTQQATALFEGQLNWRKASMISLPGTSFGGLIQHQPTNLGDSLVCISASPPFLSAIADLIFN
jgi:hypothetical protein